jgi:S-DNA-T family DNA segregation ATPase FtsK/SpoIIIE
MVASDLIGEVAASYLRAELASDRAGAQDGTSRYIIDCLTPEQIVAIAKAVLRDEDLSQNIDLKLPRKLTDGYGLPDSVLTDRPATYFRNASCEKPVRVVANIGDDEQQSLKEFISIGATELQDRSDLWVEVGSKGLGLLAEHAKWWEKALLGLQQLRLHSLDRFAAYVLRTREMVEAEGQPILVALGAALPALRLPKHSLYFNGIKEKFRGRASEWKNHFSSAVKKRACYLLKQTPTQILLDEDELLASFEKVKDTIPEMHYPQILSFIRAPFGWNNAAADLAECEWEDISPLFHGLKQKKHNLGEETLAFYDERQPELLSEDDRDYLVLLSQRRTSDPEEEDVLFYDNHRNELKEDRKLKSAWDRFIFGRPREDEDFIAGIASCLESLFNQETPGVKRRLKIRCDSATKKELRSLNIEAGRYFAKRYQGVTRLFGASVSWDVGQLFNFPTLISEWSQRGQKQKLNRSVARAALQLKFLLELEVEDSDGNSQTYSTQLVWKYDPNAVTSQFADDWARLEEHPLVCCRANRELMSGKGRFQTVDLSNVKTFVPTFGKNRGSFVSIYSKQKDIGLAWVKNLREALRESLITKAVAELLETKFRAFESSYRVAIQGFAEQGVSHPALFEQLKTYAELLDTICRQAKGDRNRELLLRPLLQVGTVLIDGDDPAAVVAPWHPLRLAAIYRKAEMVAGLIKHLLMAEEVLFGDARLFFKDLKKELAHPFYPEVTLGWNKNEPKLLVLSDVVGDYSLHESPIVGEKGSGETNENPAEGSECVLQMVERYLALHPHEQANLSVVLFNCDSARLPQAVVDKFGDLYEEDEDVRCQVILRHTDHGQLRDLYREILDSADANVDSFNASEATQDFMARLRIGILVDQAPPPNPKDGCPYDIVFSQDVIARHARVEWYPENAKPLDFDQLVPPRWSRRRPAAKDDMKSVVYLTCPVRSEEGWAFLTALTTFFKGDWDDDETTRLLPARQLDFRNSVTARIFEETHNLGSWVVNYDELLDRRQLLNQGVRVIRYKQSATQGRNLIVSSNAPLGLLKSMVLSRMRELNLGLQEADYHDLADRFIADANDISGDIVLRAAKRGRNASELMGIVLSRYLIRSELGRDHYYGWYFLDDYAEWLGQREQQIADILALSPEQIPGGALRLALVVAEAKYIEAPSLAAKRKESQKQVRDTIKRIHEAVFGNPQRLDRDLWLARLSDLILDGVQFPASARINLADWRRAVRDGECEIYVRGYSHVFVSGPPDSGECSSFLKISGVEDSYQEVYGRPEVRDLVLIYLRDEDPAKVRESISGQKIWEGRIYRRPTERDHQISKVETVEVKSIHPESVTPAQSKSEPDGEVTPQESGKVSSKTISQEQISPEPIPEETGWKYSKIAGLISAESREEDSSGDQEWLKNMEFRTRNALQQFHLQAKLVESILTPNCALLKFAGSSNLTVEQVLRRRTEFLTTHGLNVVSVRPEPGVVSISIERPARRVITIQQLWARWKPDSEGGNQEILIGVREDDASLLFLDPASRHAPHTLIAGSTGSGKSVLMQNIILAIAGTNTPEQARIVLIDPKQGVDYFQFEGLPHLEGRLIDNQEQALESLSNLVTEMDERYTRLRAARVPNLSAYNQKVSDSERLPVIWLIHDEFAEWMLVEEYKQLVTSSVARLGVKARAAGIYLVFAAQRPDANVMPMQLRANLGNRLILRVDSDGTSDIALGEAGAERLLGRGHLLAKLEGVHGLSYAQVPFVESSFMEQFVQVVLDMKATALSK